MFKLLNLILVREFYSIFLELRDVSGGEHQTNQTMDKDRISPIMLMKINNIRVSLKLSTLTLSWLLGIHNIIFMGNMLSLSCLDYLIMSLAPSLRREQILEQKFPIKLNVFA